MLVFNLLVLRSFVKFVRKYCLVLIYFVVFIFYYSVRPKTHLIFFFCEPKMGPNLGPLPFLLIYKRWPNSRFGSRPSEAHLDLPSASRLLHGLFPCIFHIMPSWFHLASFKLVKAYSPIPPTCIAARPVSNTKPPKMPAFCF